MKEIGRYKYGGVSLNASSRSRGNGDERKIILFDSSLGSSYNYLYLERWYSIIVREGGYF
ncbi:MAG: hypothetical protein JSW35_06510 [Deltaproteobacteria bacterium]|nr:MAG: hypothetical protein JSW35_06510 [Deltaproteobacteria bacterium]